MGTTRKHARRRERGNVAAELALALPVTMFVLLGLIDVGRGVAARASLASAARAATRYASVRSSTSSDPATSTMIATYLRERVTGLNPDQVTVTTAWSPANTRGSRVHIDVSYTFTPMIKFIPITSIQMTTSSESIISN